ncbi:MAG TPA: DUF3488 and transglutaminase-like domain-containing protein [Thermodesulfobacteriota bacterium]|nr:DUF3488 and transglutaminase-like domain-containing protein [Thermodesulfobacteriota bacterium]
MNVSQALVLFTHLIALTGFFAVFVTGQLDEISVFVFSASLLLSFINERFQKQYYLTQNVATVLAVLLLVYVFASVIVLGVEVFNGILVFLIYTQVLKLLGRKGMRDIVQIYILSFFQFLAGAILTVDFSYGVVFIVYVAVAIWAIMVFSMRKESIEASSNDDPRVVTPLFLSTTVIISLGIFLFTALIFISVPRMRSGFLVSDFIKPESLRTGFSDEVRLGQVGEIKLDSSPVLRARILSHEHKNLPKTIYWRGVALDEFDGKTWRVSDLSFKSHKKGRDGIVRVRETRNQTLIQDIVTEPLDTEVLFAANFPVGFGGNMVEVAEINDSYILPGKVSYRLKYLAYSNLHAASPDDLRKEEDEYPLYIKARYLQLPKLSEKVKELANDITSSDRNAYDKAVSIKRYLVSNMGYTLTLEKGTTEFPLEDFLFKNRAGHCEYFATAMVVLLREVGIPARMVNGFVGGEWNDYGKFFLVRESDAHSWVEVFSPEHGWVLFDPTPAGDGELLGYSNLSSYIDYLRYRWNTYVVDFNQGNQVRLFSEFRNKWRWQRSRIQNSVNSKPEFNKKWVFSILVLALFTWVLMTKPEVKSLLNYRRRKPEEKVSQLYIKALSLLSKKGFKKADFVTPREFAKDVIGRGGKDFETFQHLTEIYLNLRFGGYNKKGNDISDLERLLDKLKKKLDEGRPKLLSKNRRQKMKERLK